MIFNVDDRSQTWNSVGGTGANCRHRIPAMLADKEQCTGPRLFEDKPEFAFLIGWVGGNQDQTGKAGCIFDNYPFGDIGCPDANALARFKAREQCARQSLGIVEKRAIGPSSPGLAINANLDQCNRIRRSTRLFAKYSADCCLADREILLRRKIGVAECNLVRRLRTPHR